MKSIVDGLKPEILWKHFDNITKIPRPSKHEEKILQFLKNFANERNLKYGMKSMAQLALDYLYLNQ